MEHPPTTILLHSKLGYKVDNVIDASGLKQLDHLQISKEEKNLIQYQALTEHATFDLSASLVDLYLVLLRGGARVAGEYPLNSASTASP